MKKLSTTKLSFHTETVRRLDEAALAAVNGGATTRDHVTHSCPGVCVQPTEDCNIKKL